MADKSVESRLGGLEARADVADERWGDVKDYMIRNGDTLTQIHKTLTSINGNIANFQEYQRQCDADRAKLETDHNDLEKRVTATEGTAGRQIKAALVAGGVISGIISGGPKLWDAIKGLFS